MNLVDTSVTHELSYTIDARSVKHAFQDSPEHVDYSILY